MHIQLMAWHTDQGRRIALVGKGRKWLQVLIIDAGGLIVRRVPATEARYMAAQPDYPLARAVRRFRKAGREFGANKTARELLRKAQQDARNSGLRV